MTAAFDQVASDLSLPDLELPDWLPGSVAEEARKMYDGILRKKRQEEPLSAEGCALFLKKIELLRRLTSDRRMKNVWRELYRKRRRPLNEFINPAKKVYDEIQFDTYKKLPFLHDEKNQDLACREFFGHAFQYAVQCFDLPNQSEINSLLEPYAKMAIRLRRDARNLASLGLREFALDLEAMAVVCEENANQPDLRSLCHPIVKRSRGDRVLRAYIYRLSSNCRGRFGKWLPGTVATTAGVMLSKTITGNKVREIMRGITRHGAATLKAKSKRSSRSSELVEEFGQEAGDEWGTPEQPGWKGLLTFALRHPKCTNQHMIESMARSNYKVLCDQHAEDPNFDEDKTYEQCLDEARNIVLDTTYKRLYRP